jgi:hypothetical protein
MIDRLMVSLYTGISLLLLDTMGPSLSLPKYVRSHRSRRVWRRWLGCCLADQQIPLQIPAGTAYTVFMVDSSGYFSTYSRPLPLPNRTDLVAGLNPTEIQMAGSGPNSACLDSVLAHSKDFTFTVSGSTAMCESNFQISYVDTLGNGPHNFTVLPLDASTGPWDQPLVGGASYDGPSSWNVNMTTGTRFTIMLK